MADDEQISIYDEVEIEDMTYDETLQIYHYPCPCGDRFEIALYDLMDGEDIGVCPSCSLMIRVIFEVVSIPGSTTGVGGGEEGNVDGWMADLRSRRITCRNRLARMGASRLLLLLRRSVGRTRSTNLFDTARPRT